MSSLELEVSEHPSVERKMCCGLLGFLPPAEFLFRDAAFLYSKLVMSPFILNNERLEWIDSRREYCSSSILIVETINRYVWMHLSCPLTRSRASGASAFE
mmetsp:Transcript_21909/g.48966  ORF Transcript_21909/g.48966 Transcript_21909/m.48966 type:complete len:100 (-) Transcript_21909:54-353(-)